MRTLKIKRGNIALTVNIKSQNYTIEFNGELWQSGGRKSYINFNRRIGNKFLPIMKKLSFAKSVTGKVVIYEDYSAIECDFSGYRVLGVKNNVCIKTEYRLYDNGKLDFIISAQNEDENYLHSILWPRACNKLKYNKSEAYSVHSYRQGCLIEDGTKMKFLEKFVMTSYPRNVNTGDCYMPLYGRVVGKCGYCSYVEDANDCAICGSFDKGMSVISSPMFYSSLGALRYSRILHMRFFENCDYNTFAKEYRHFLINNGKFITLEEKIKRNPNVARLIGTPVIHTNIFSKIQAESDAYIKGKDEILHATFEERAEQFKKFKELGLEKAYIHLDGWGNQGYDNLHPYILPPCPQAGGAKGMKKLADTCQKIGYIFGLHDQYRDFYTRSNVYDSDKAVKRIDGTSYLCKTWAGGAHNWLCTSFAPDYVTRTYNELKDLGVNVEGTYLDVFSIVLGDECFHEKHRITRTQSIEYRKKCFDILRKRGLIVCSEEPGCLMIDAIDMVHHAPYCLSPQDGGHSLGTSIPLFNLVYHDCIFMPWGTDGTGGWGIPKDEAGALHCVLNASTPYFNGFEGTHMETIGDILSDEIIKEKIDTIKRLCIIQSQLYNKEMLKHEFLSNDNKIQRCIYSDGTVITVNYAENTYNVDYGKQINE